MTAKAALYSAVGDELTHYELGSASLIKRGTVTVPANVQYAWPHPSRRYLYVSTSNRGSSPKADLNHVSAYRIGAGGSLTPHGEPKPLRHRAVHMCLDPSGSFALNAHNLPQCGITIHAIGRDGTIGAEVQQPDGLEYGIYPHQVRVTPSGSSVVLVDRGNSAGHGKPEDPGRCVRSALPTAASRRCR